MTGRRRPGKRVTTHPPVQASERRAAQRVPVRLMVRFSATNHFQHVGHGTALDLSESGCKVCSTEALPIGSSWDLYLTIPAPSRPILVSEGRVIWAANSEYGIEFLQITTRERTRLRHFLWKQMTRSILDDGRPLFTLVDHSNPRRPYLKPLP